MFHSFTNTSSQYRVNWLLISLLYCKMHAGFGAYGFVLYSGLRSRELVNLYRPETAQIIMIYVKETYLEFNAYNQCSWGFSSNWLYLLVLSTTDLWNVKIETKCRSRIFYLLASQHCKFIRVIGAFFYRVQFFLCVFFAIFQCMLSSRFILFMAALNTKYSWGQKHYKLRSILYR